MNPRPPTLDDLLPDGKSYEDLALSIGLSTKALWALRRGAVRPHRGTVKLLAAALQRSQEEILTAIRESARSARRHRKKAIA